jgi:hypothetical protein
VQRLKQRREALKRRHRAGAEADGGEVKLELELGGRERPGSADSVLVAGFDVAPDGNDDEDDDEEEEDFFLRGGR